MSQKKLDFLKAMLADCASKEGASDADLQEILAKKPPSTHAGKCIGACDFR